MAACEREEIETSLLHFLNSHDEIADTLEFARDRELDHQRVVGVIKSLESDKFVSTEKLSSKKIELTEEARTIVENGSAEFLVFSGIPSAGIPKTDLASAIGDSFNVGFSHCMKKKWISLNKSTQLVTKLVSSIEDETRDALVRILENDGAPTIVSEATINELKRRKLINMISLASFHVTKGESFSTERTKLPAELTHEMIANGSWETTEFKPYNFDSLGADPSGGHLHPLLKVRTQFRSILLEMGFEEMPTNKFVESSFWNFDSLFQPQQHPARDMHDTFFIADPARTTDFPEDYLERVKQVHQIGGYGSFGYRYDWKLEEAQKNILRTHTTAISSQMLYKLAQDTKEHGFQAKKYFSIDRVFRNETLDATHLAEFHQIEGLVADRNLGLGDLIGVIAHFFERIGITQLRFKPAYNPYTEPSMEIFGFHPDRGDWTEVGNSGIFRPEMLLPMGLPEDVRVIAWGLSLERPTMIKYGLKNIRDLFGHKVDLSFVRSAAIVNFG